MKFFLISFLSLTILACCEPAADNSIQAGNTDSCKIALKFESAGAAESMVASGYTGVLRNFRGEDTSSLDFIHVFEDGEITESVFYHANGNKEEEYQYRCGALHGEQKFYYENGQLGRTISYSYGYRHGTGKLFNEKGDLLQTVIFERDSLVKDSGNPAQ